MSNSVAILGSYSYSIVFVFFLLLKCHWGISQSLADKYHTHKTYIKKYVQPIFQLYFFKSDWANSIQQKQQMSMEKEHIA